MRAFRTDTDADVVGDLPTDETAVVKWTLSGEEHVEGFRLAALGSRRAWPPQRLGVPLLAERTFCIRAQRVSAGNARADVPVVKGVARVPAIRTHPTTWRA